VLWWAERVARLERSLAEIPLVDAMIIGCAQALALVPGTSRSGITISAGLFRGIDRASAARFSFLLSSPIILGASAKAAVDVFREGGIPLDMRAPFAVGLVVSAIAGYGVIALFLRYLQTATLKIFVVYRIIFGIIVLALAFLWRFPGAAHL
jgi:undecaprenyl-diphosphatase